MGDNLHTFQASQKMVSAEISLVDCDPSRANMAECGKTCRLP